MRRLRFTAFAAWVLLAGCGVTALGAAFFLMVWRLLGRRPLIPVGDLRLSRALRHQTE